MKWRSTYRPISFQPLTIPLVNVRFWLARLQNDRWITALERAAPTQENPQNFLR